MLETQLDESGEILLRAAKLIEERGWWDGVPNSEFYSNGCICAAMALNSVHPINKDPGKAADAKSKAWRRLLDHIGLKTRECIPHWNDHSTAEIVIRTMKEAAYAKTST